VTEADDSAAKQIAAKKDAMQKQIQQKIAQKQMQVMQAKANKRISDIKASNDKCTCGSTNESKMKCEVHGGEHGSKLSGGKEKIEVNPPLKEAGELPKKVITKGHEIAKSLIKHRAKVREPYAVGMAAAKKSAGIKEGTEQIDEKVKTSHEDPLVTVHDKNGLHTHANLSTANKIFNTKVKHTDVHAGPVKTKDGHETKNDLKFAISKHHASAIKKD
jgi:hypothetical protein